MFFTAAFPQFSVMIAVFHLPIVVVKGYRFISEKVGTGKWSGKSSGKVKLKAYKIHLYKMVKFRILDILHKI